MSGFYEMIRRGQNITNYDPEGTVNVKRMERKKN